MKTENYSKIKGSNAPAPSPFPPLYPSDPVLDTIRNCHMAL